MSGVLRLCLLMAANALRPAQMTSSSIQRRPSPAFCSRSLTMDLVKDRGFPPLHVMQKNSDRADTSYGLCDGASLSFWKHYC